MHSMRVSHFNNDGRLYSSSAGPRPLSDCGATSGAFTVGNKSMFLFEECFISNGRVPVTFGSGLLSPPQTIFLAGDLSKWIGDRDAKEDFFCEYLQLCLLLRR